MFAEDAGIKNYSKLDLSPVKSAETNETISMGFCRTHKQTMQTQSMIYKPCREESAVQVVFWSQRISLKSLSDPFSDAYCTVFWKPSWQLHLHGMKFYTLLLAGKHVCLKPLWLFVLLETTALTKNKRQFYPQEKASLPSQARNNKILFSSSSTFQDRALASLLLC